MMNYTNDMWVISIKHILMKQKIISQIVKEFLKWRIILHNAQQLIQLLIKKDNPEFQYLAYLLI